MARGKEIYKKEDGSPQYEVDYALNILKNNPISENELKAHMGKSRHEPHGIPAKIWRTAWSKYFTTNKKIMVYTTYPTEEYWYVDKLGRKVK